MKHVQLQDKSDDERRAANLTKIFVYGDARRIRGDRRKVKLPVASDRRESDERRSGGDRRDYTHALN